MILNVSKGENANKIKVPNNIINNADPIFVNFVPITSINLFIIIQMTYIPLSFTPFFFNIIILCT